MDTKFSYQIEGFEGPLDLLLYLIARNKLNIEEIQLTVIVEQYLEHIRLMQERDMDVASEFLEMASRLIYLKTVSLLPKHEEVDQLKDELTAELMEYEHCRRIASALSKMTDAFDTFVKKAENIEFDKTYELTHEKDLLVGYYLSAVGRGQRKLPPPTTVFSKIVAKKIVSVSSKIVFVLRNLIRGGDKKINSFFDNAESRSELVATFLALLELCKANRISINGEEDDLKVSVIKGKNK